MTAVIWDKKKYKVTWYLLNRKWCEVRLKATLVSSNIDFHMIGYSKVTCRWVSNYFYRFWWSLFRKLSSGSKNVLFICYKQFKNYESFKLNLSCKIIRENLYAICDLLWEKGPTAVKRCFKTQLTAFCRKMLCNIFTSVS